ncbi:MAG: polyprenyl synthetase family protein [Bdellovibrionales bacterium]|nr:polyprenyl synthetase family protein [Bdellovibrionales bacterium]
MDLNRATSRPHSDLFREQVLQRLGEAVGGSFIREKLEPLVLSPTAKLLRPRLVCIFGSIAGSKPESLVDVAASAELLHVASLVHDDIIDESDERRGMPTLHKLSGNQIAVLAGDFLLAQALRLTARGGPLLVDAAARAMAEMSESATREVDARRSPGGAVFILDSEALRCVAAGKTGALFGYCLEAGALLANKPDLAKVWRGAGIHLGVAFQYLDDLLDLRGGAGKPRGADLRERNPNAVLSAMASVWNDNEADYLLLSDFVGKQKYSEACDLLLASGAIAQVHQWIQHELSCARDLLGPVAAQPDVAAIFAQLQPR